MPISINNNDSFENEDNSWLNIELLKNHLKSFSEIYYDQCENQSVRDKTVFFSLENEAVYDREQIKTDHKIKQFGYAQYESYNEIDSDIIYQNSVNSIHLKDKTDGTCDNMSNYIIKEENENKCYVLEKYPNYGIGELVCSKLRFNELIKLEKLLYTVGNIQVDYKPQQTSNNLAISSAHLHTSFSNTESRRKIASKNGYRFFLDLADFITINLKLPKLHNSYFRFNGFNDWCKRGFNTKQQRVIAQENNGIGTGSQRYYNMNDCSFVKMNHGRGRLLKTIENRSFTIYRDMNKTIEALRMYRNGLNKFLKFYENVTAQTMELKDLYLRIDNKAHRFKNLVLPNNQSIGMNLDSDKIRENNNVSLREIRDSMVIS